MEQENNVETKAYLLRSKNALKATQVLLNNQCFQEAISRAYYVMFYAASALLCTLDKTTSKAAEEYLKKEKLI